jgi:hypothetical protein
MPSSDQLPESMRSLARRQNFELSDRGWEEACRRLARAIEDAVAPSPAPPAAGGRPSAEPAVPLPEKPAATVSSGSPQRRWGMGIAATIVAALVLAIVLFLKSSAPANQPPTGDGGPDGPGPDPPKAAAPTRLDLGLEGRWRLEATGDSDAGRVLIERNGTTLRLAVIELGGARHDLGTATVEETVMQFDFADARLGALHAEASKSSPGDWAVRWSSSECSNADVTLATSTDLRIWKGHMKCFDARRSLTESVEFSASLASDRNTLTLTAQEDGGGKGATIVLRRE